MVEARASGQRAPGARRRPPPQSRCGRRAAI